MAELAQTDDERRVLEYLWPFWARPKQLAPAGEWSYWLLLAGRGFGKMVSMDTKLPTPTGWTTLADVKVGDEVFDENGNVCKVTFVAIPELAQEAYRLTFSDGTQIEACGDHLWATWTHAERKAFLRSPYEDTSKFPDNWFNWRLKRIVGGMYLSRETVEKAISLYRGNISIRGLCAQLKISRNAITPHLKAGKFIEREAIHYPDSPGPQVRTTREIVNTLTTGKRKDSNHCIPNCRPLNLPDRDLPIPPYVLGYWLGDGHSKESAITIADYDCAEVERFFLEDGVVFHGKERRKSKVNCATKMIQFANGSSLASSLRKVGVWANKHIPVDYLRSSSRQRMLLLQGLMDSDGGSDTPGWVSFTNTNKKLADAVYELVVSLGFRAHRDSRTPTLNGVTCAEAHRIAFIPTKDVFRLTRKANQVVIPESQLLRRHHRMIVRAERIEPKMMRCISVDSPNRMYLVSGAMIPTHNTRSATEWARYKAETMPGSRGAIVSSTAADARDIVVEGESGILAVSPPWNKPIYEPSKRRVTWPNGTIATLYTADEPNRLRGPSHHWAIADELAAWRFLDDAWSNLMFGLRLGENPQCAIATTPRPIVQLRELLKDPGTVTTRGSTYENRGNLAPAFLSRIVSRYLGTRLGRQELEAEILDDVPGALWTHSLLDEHRVKAHPDLVRVVVAIDPAATSAEGSNETGIIVAGIDGERHGYVLEDLTCQLTPAKWGEVAVKAFDKYQADRIVAETNQGGEMVEHVVMTAAKELYRQNLRSTPKIAYRGVRATRGKYTRAEPISALYEQGRVHHVGMFAKLEDELCSWVPGEDSPDRLDATVWAFTDLLLQLGEQRKPQPTVSMRTF